MKYTVIYTGQFKRSLKKCAKRGLNIKTFTDALDILQETGTLPSQYKAHRCRMLGMSSRARLANDLASE